MMRARGILAVMVVAAVAAAALGGLVGCSKELRPVGNLPPETYVFIQGPVDTVNHRIRLHWYGTDPDGEVQGYALRWVYPSPAPQNPPWDTIACVKSEEIVVAGLKSPTVKQRIGITDSVFTMFTGDSGVVSPRFEIFAIDNEGASDLSPAVQGFLLSNSAPEVRFTVVPGSRDSTYASVTVTWETIDPDGGGPGLHYRVWLDGNEAGYDSTSAQTFTVPSARFLQDGTYRSGPRTVFVQAVDDGGRSGPPSGSTWYVRAPAAVLESNQGRLLVVDEVPSSGQNNSLYDGFYKGIADLLPAGTYSTLRTQFNPGIFRNARDLAQTFRQFKAVLWYRGGQTTVSTLLGDYQDSIGAYVDAGGKFYLDGLYLAQGLRSPGALRQDFVTRYLGSTGLVNCFTNIGSGSADSTAGWGARNGSKFRSSRYGEAFSLLAAPFRMTDSTGGVRGFAVTDTANVALWAMVGALEPPNLDFEVPVGVTVPQGANGRIVLISLPVRLGPPTPAANLVRRVLYEFGIGIPLP